LHTAPIKLPIYKTLDEALTLLIRGRVAFGKAMLAPIVIGFTTGYAVDLMPQEETLTTVAGSFAIILDIILWATFAVNCHRIALLGPDSGLTAYSLVIGRRQLNFAGYTFLFIWFLPFALGGILITLTALISLSLGIAFGFGPDVDLIPDLDVWLDVLGEFFGLGWVSYIVALATILMFAAFFLTFTGLMVPALAVDRDMSLTTGFIKSKGNLRRVFYLVSMPLSFQVVAIFPSLASDAFPGMAHFLVGISSVLSFCAWALTACVLSRSYAVLVGLDSPVEKRDFTIARIAADRSGFIPRYVDAACLQDETVVVYPSWWKQGYRLGRSKFELYLSIYEISPTGPIFRTRLHWLAAAGLLFIPFIFFMDEIGAFVVENPTIVFSLYLVFAIVVLVRVYGSQRFRQFRRDRNDILADAPRMSDANVWRRRAVYWMTTDAYGMATCILASGLFSLPLAGSFFLFSPIGSGSEESTLLEVLFSITLFNVYALDLVAHILVGTLVVAFIFLPPLGLLAHLLYRHRHGRGPTKEDVIALSGYRETAG